MTPRWKPPTVLASTSAQSWVSNSPAPPIVVPGFGLGQDCEGWGEVEPFEQVSALGIAPLADLCSGAVNYRHFPVQWGERVGERPSR